MVKNLFSEAPTDNCPAMSMFPGSNPYASDHGGRRGRIDD